MKNEALEAINRVITQFFQMFDNRGGQVPDFSLMDQLLIASVVIHKVDHDQIETMDSKVFLQLRVQLFESGQITHFHEWETDSETTINGHLASRVSTYEKSGLFDKQNFIGSGTKHFQ